MPVIVTLLIFIIGEEGELGKLILDIVPKIGALNTDFINVSGVLREVKLTSASAGIDGITTPPGETYVGSEVVTNAKVIPAISCGRLVFFSTIILCNAFMDAYRTTKYSASSGKLAITLTPSASTVGYDI